MSNISKRIAELSPERRELLARLSKRERLDVARAVIMPRPRGLKHLPLSFAQQRLWFLQQLKPDSPFYNIPDATYFDGPLDIAALEQSFGEIVRRHEALRTTFQTVYGEPVQIVAPPEPVRLEVVDLTALLPDRREDEARRLADEEARAPFDLARGPLLRLRLLKLEEAKHILLVTMHHIITDGWSMNVLARELSALYAAFGEGKGSPLAELPVQYADFAIWQREWLKGEVLEEQLRYWREKLGGGLPVLELPADRTRPAAQTYGGATEVRELDEQLSRRVKELGRDSGATLFMTLLAAFNVLLARYTGQEDIVVGAPIAGRNRAEVEDLIGFFVNTLALRTDLSGDPTFLEVLARTRETTLGAYAHQDVPFEKLVEELQPERRASQTPLFQAVFTVQNAQAAPSHLAETRMEGMPTETETAKFDLRLAVTDLGDTLGLSMRYSTELFEAGRVRRMLEHFERLLESVVADPSARLSDLAVIGERERRQLLDCWGESRESFAVRECLHEMFAARARETPEAVALVCGDERVTYRELDRRANRLAHRLRALGAGPEVIVGVCVGRSPDMIVGLLAVLKAGGAYLPLEPEHPADRLAFMLEDARARVLLTESALAEKFDRRGVEVVCLDAGREAAGGGGDEPPPSGATPDNLAYVIYTSGSTGRPKGTLITHRNVARLFEATRAWFGFDARDVWTLFHSYAFDFSVWEMWGALVYGGRLVVVPYLVSRSPEAFHELLLAEGVTVLNQTPSAFRQLMRADEGRAGAGTLSLRLVVFGGEALDLQSLKPWFGRHGDERPRLVNMYGITETTVHVTYRPVTSRDADGTAGSRIGMPIPDLDVYVLDRRLRPVPFGVPGEMYVGGAGLARAYLNRAGLTAERFPPNPFSARPGERLYKTGDLVRLLDGGDLEYLGRVDQQVKIRGFRIELGEIEAALAGHPSVGACAVVAREDEPGDRRLAAYLVGRGHGPTPNVNELRAFLGTRLPGHMMPASFVWLDSLPLTINGKLDRRALPAPGQARPSLERSYVAPRDRLEALLAEMWKELLGIEQVGVEDDFFGLGGDSIRGAIFINRLQERLGEIVHVITIFQSPTIAGLAAYLKEQYAEAVRRIDGPPSAPPPVPSTEARGGVDAAKVMRLRQLVRPLPPRPAAVEKNPPAVFVLSAPRSGSTLFRVMLAGHPALFAPPELELLSFDTLAERREVFSGAQSFWLEGTVRAVMEIKGCGADEAKAVMRDWERRGLTTKECYRLLQDWLGERRLVDKTPSYALDGSILRRAEADFRDALYVHLLRHPYGMIRSFEEARLEQIFFRYEHGFTRRELAELIWLVSNENILDFLGSVPRERQHRVRFEDLLERPEETLRGVCRFLGLEFAADMLEPYRDKEKRMTDGIHAQSRMLGDVKFHRYAGIEAGVGSRWRTQGREDSLAEETWRVAEACGYEREPEAGGESAGALRRGLKPIPRLADYDGARLPLSFAQQRLWFIHQLSPDSPAYNIPVALRLSGRLDVSALQESLGEIVRRHTSLRTTFPAAEGQPVQLISPYQLPPMPLVDLSGLAEDAREDRALRLSSEEAQRPFDLARGPLLRLRLLRLEEEEHVLLVTMHHIVSDGWSMGVMMRELESLYGAFRAGSVSPLEELQVQYADYAVWQREWLQGAALEEQLRYWRGQLGGELPVLELPSDRTRPAAQTYRGAVEAFELGVRVRERLKEVSREGGATLFTTLLAAFDVLLYRYTGQTDICVGTPVAGRNRAELEPLIGLFVNTLVLRTRLSGGDRFGELLERVREVTQAAYRRQDVPFEKLVDELQPPRDPSHTPLFQVMFTLQSASREELSLEGIEISGVETEGEVAKFDLSLGMVEDDEGLGGAFVYNADLFDAPTVGRLAAHFKALLEAVAADPRQRLADLPLLTESERRQLLVEYNNTQSVYLRGQCLHQLFERQAGRTPDAAAVLCGHEAVTYAELNGRANRLARHLRALGAGPESLVGVLLGRSAEMVVALLAILKAGAAYVPLDPEYPRERLAFMLEDVGARLVLSEQRLAARLPEGSARILRLDAADGALAQHGAEDLPPHATPQNLAYVIYTSGSTGTPKGVAIEHRSASALLGWAAGAFPEGALSGVLASTSISFDLSVFELFAPLACGGRVILAENALHLPTLEGAVGVTLINTVPSAMAELVRWGAVPAGVRVVNLAGEALSDRLAQAVYEGGRVEEVRNLYGPSEDTTYSTYAVVERGAGREPGIGRPVSGTQAYVLDGQMGLVPAGAVGELYLGGAGLARGYIKRPGLTAERFIPDPFSGERGARLYRTGDLVRYRSDGELEYLGRIDQQVKLRGFRIELGEIEARLREHEAVREAVVVAREDAPGDKRLVAYVVAEDGPAADADVWRGYLKERLPDYMVPAAFVRVEEMPLTSNGKINRRALQSLAPAGPERREAFVAPRDELETRLARIWEDLLDVRPVGVRDNFFALGGHSLLTARLAAQVRRELGRELPLAMFLQAQTVEELAGVLRRPSDARSPSPLVPIQPQGVRPPFFCVHPAGGTVAGYSDLSRHLGLNQPFYGLRVPALDAGRQSNIRLEEMAARYVEAVRSVHPAGPYALGGWSMGGVVAFEMAQQLQRQGERVALLALIDSHAPRGEAVDGDQHDEALLHQFVGYMARLFGMEEWLMREDAPESRGAEEHLRLLLEQGVRSGAVPPELGMGQVRQLFQIFRTNVRGMLSYEPKPYAGRVTLLRASQQLSDRLRDPANGWQELAAEGVDIHLIPGDHYTMMKEPNVRVLAERLNACLGRLPAQQGTRT